MVKVHCPELFEPTKRGQDNKARNEFLRQNYGVDPLYLAQDLGLQVRTVMMLQRKLGLRPFLHSPRKADRISREW